MPDSSPIWNLNDLYVGMDDSALAADLAAARQDAATLAANWQGKLATATGAELASVIAEYERIFESLGKVHSHAQLLFAANTIDAAIAKHHQSVREAGAEINATLLFIELETAVMDDAHVTDLMKTSECAYWQPIGSLGCDGCARWHPISCRQIWSACWQSARQPGGALGFGCLMKPLPR